MSLFINDEDVLGWVHLSFEDVLSLLTPLPGILKEANEGFLESIEELKEKKYWKPDTVFDRDFEELMEYVVKFCDTCVKEISEVLEEIQVEVLPHHAQRLHVLYKGGIRLYERFKEVCKDPPTHFKEYGEGLRARGLVLILTLVHDLGPALHRLDDFSGRKKDSKQISNPEQLQIINLPKTDDEPESPSNAFLKEGEFWRMRYEEKEVLLRDRKGFQYIAILLQHPNEPLYALDLYHKLQQHPSALKREGVLGKISDKGESEVQGLRETNLDDSFLDIRDREEDKKLLKKLKKDLEIAEELGNETRINEIREQMIEIADQLMTKNDSIIQRARKAVLKSITDGLKMIKEEHVPLYNHLSTSVNTGRYCSYRPEKTTNWKI
jgi:hypothetical protein